MVVKSTPEGSGDAVIVIGDALINAPRRDLEKKRLLFRGTAYIIKQQSPRNGQ